MPAAYPRVPEPAMELPSSHDRNTGQGKRRKERATPAEPQRFRPAYFYHSSASEDCFLVLLPNGS